MTCDFINSTQQTITMKKLKLGFISWTDPRDRRSMSGTYYKIYESLSALGYDIVWLQIRATRSYCLLCKLANLLKKMTGRGFDVRHSVWGSSILSKTIDREKLSSCGIVFAPFASEALYALKTDKPIIYLSDATFGIMVDYYWKNLYPKSILQGNIVEQRTLDMSQAVIVSSDWAACSVVNYYHQPKEKVHVIEFGANIDDKDIIPHKFCYKGHLDLLFLGVDWQRKGGSIAVDACRWLNDNGIDSTLHIVGIKDLDESVRSLPFVDYIGFLNKNIPEQYSKLVSTIKSCHCLLLPTKAECSAIAFCESSANGLPVFSHNTGGVSNYVYDGRNGYLLPLGSTGADFGRKIKQSLDSGELARMSETAKQVYRERLNWGVWGQKVDKIIKDIMNQKSSL